MLRNDKNKQYLIARDTSDQTKYPVTVRHLTKKSALEEAERLAQKTGKKFTIFESFLKVENESLNNKMIFICSPYRRYNFYNEYKNITKALKYCETIIKQGGIPIAPHIMYTSILNDKNEEEREKGINLGLKLLKKCDYIYVYGDYISNGMKREIEFAEKNNIPIKHKEK